MKQGLTAIALAALLSSSLSWTVMAQQQQSTVPDAPTPQAPRPLADVNGPITPGVGAGSEPSAPTSSSNPPVQQQAPSSQSLIKQVKDEVQPAPPELPAAGEGVAAITTLIMRVNFVEVPVTVKDPKGKLVAGLTYRDFKIYENDTREPLAFFIQEYIRRV